MEAKAIYRQPAVAAWLAGPVAVGLGVAAHLVSGGAVPAVSVLAALAALVGMLASMIGRLNVPVWGVLLLSGAVQQGLHLAFSVFSEVFPGTAPLGHGHPESAWQPPQLSSASGPHARAGELMLDTHVAAALLTALVLANLDGGISRVRTLLHRGTPTTRERHGGHG